MAKTQIDISDIIDRQAIGNFQKQVTGLCAVIAALEGFNTQSAGYVAPALAQHFSMQPRDLGLFFSLGLLGLLCGALFIAPLADRLGRRSILLCCVPLLGIFALLTAFSTSVTMLDLLRFATGLAIGGALPNTIALTSEYAPHRRRTVMIVIMFSGFIVGSIMAAGAAGSLAAAGWKSVFLVGGSLSLIFTPVVFLGLPESVRFLTLRSADPTQIVRLLNRAFPGLQLDPDVIVAAAEPASRRISLRALFEAGRTRGTVLIWIISFSSLFDVFLMANWLPTEMRALGFPTAVAILVGATFQIGGLIGVAFGWIADRIGANRTLSLAYLTGACGVLLIPISGANATTVIAAVALSGFGIIGGQAVTNAVSAMFYPTEIRSTGVGWATGIGRVGSIIGPAIAGMLLQISIPATDVILLAAIPAAVAAAAAFALERSRFDFLAEKRSVVSARRLS